MGSNPIRVTKCQFLAVLNEIKFRYITHSSSGQDVWFSTRKQEFNSPMGDYQLGAVTPILRNHKGTYRYRSGLEYSSRWLRTLPMREETQVRILYILQSANIFHYNGIKYY